MHRKQGPLQRGPFVYSKHSAIFVRIVSAANTEELSTKIDWSPFVIMGNTMPPRDPDEDEEDEDEEDRADEPPVVREPDED